MLTLGSLAPKLEFLLTRFKNFYCPAKIAKNPMDDRYTVFALHARRIEFCQCDTCHTSLHYTRHCSVQLPLFSTFRTYTSTYPARADVGYLNGMPPASSR